MRQRDLPILINILAYFLQVFLKARQPDRAFRVAPMPLIEKTPNGMKSVENPLPTRVYRAIVKRYRSEAIVST
jgi:hypothetical protein